MLKSSFPSFSVVDYFRSDVVFFFLPPLCKHLNGPGLYLHRLPSCSRSLCLLTDLQERQCFIFLFDFLNQAREKEEMGEIVKLWFSPGFLFDFEQSDTSCLCRHSPSYSWRWLTHSRRWSWPTSRLISWLEFRNMPSSQAQRSPRCRKTRACTRASAECKCALL